jgi:hypothetical protein
MNTDIINRLTEKINNYAYAEWGNDDDVHAVLWDDLNELRNLPNMERDKLLKDWKYKDAYDCTVKAHENEGKTFELLKWQNSFCLAILFMYYH